MKQNTKNLTKKITAYSAVAGTIIAIAPGVNAQIIYTDIDPDSTLGSNETYNLDLNNDATPDFNILQFESAPVFEVVGMHALGNNAVLNSGGLPTALNTNDPIDVSQSFWQTGSYQALNYYGTGSVYGNWLGVTDKYLGLRIVVGSDTLYGWARLDVANDATSFTIKDYAYNVTPNESILAGQTTLVNVKETDINKNVSVYSFGKKVYINTNKNKGTITILNSLGQVAANSSIKNSQTIINVAHIKSGIYFVRIQVNEAIITKKVFIE